MFESFRPPVPSTRAQLASHTLLAIGFAALGALDLLRHRSGSPHNFFASIWFFSAAIWAYRAYKDLRSRSRLEQ